MTYICTEQLYLTKYHISTAQSNSDGGHFELQNGGYTQIITSPPEGVARYCFHPVCLSVCVCLCVCPANILVFYFSAIRRDIDLKFIQDTYRVVLNSLTKH